MQKFNGCSDSTTLIQAELGKKTRVDYHPVLQNVSCHPEANLNMPNHQPHAFDNFFREPLPKEEKFIIDRAFKSKADIVEKQRYDKAEADLVKNLGKGEKEPSEDLILEVKPQKGKKK